jgi:hypothetical protein
MAAAYCRNLSMQLTCFFLTPARSVSLLSLGIS